MKILYNWLKEYLDTDYKPEEAAKLLTDIGLEVEHIEPYHSVKGGLNGLVIGEVKTCIKHPNADKLSLTTVDVGGPQLLNIVCGAPNVAAGQKVVVALEGTVLYPSKGEPFTIKKSKIRGEVSEGMICAEDEIGIGASHAGIIILPPEMETGLPASEYFPVYHDTILEIGITPNRADALSHIGVARDLAAAINLQPGMKERFRFKYCGHLDLPPIVPHTIEISIENPEACRRYTGFEIRGIEVRESPRWLKNYLIAIGLRPINNIVDATNFVMLELGQPLHAFDADKIKGNKVIVRKAKPGETMVTLDGMERKLNPEDLLICNESEAMCIAGVYGGKDSGITESTKNIFMESACFDAAHIRRTARRHGLHTDASYRFERGTDPEDTKQGLIRALNVLKIGKGHKFSMTYYRDFYPVEVQRREIEFSIHYFNKLAGVSLAAERIEEILGEVFIRTVRQNGDDWVVSIPTWRNDITGPADIVEEVLRFYGYNNIPIPENLNIPLVHSEKSTRNFNVQQSIFGLLSSLGFSEVMNTSLSSSRLDANPENVKIANPLSSDLDILRSSLLYNGLTNIALNRNNRRSDLKLYEFGRSYHKKPSGNYDETEHLSLWICGNKTPGSWNTREAPVDFYTLKMYIDGIIGKVGGGKINLEKASLENDPNLVYGYSISSNSGEIVKAGRVSDELLKKWEIKGEVYFAEFNWKNLLMQLPKGLVMKEMNRFPPVTRDLALIIDKSVQFSALLQIAYKAERELLKDVSVFDVYEGDGVEKDKKSYALRFILQNETKTLSDAEIDRVMEKLTKAFNKEVGAIIRS